MDKTAHDAPALAKKVKADEENRASDAGIVERMSENDA